MFEERQFLANYSQVLWIFDAWYFCHCAATNALRWSYLLSGSTRAVSSFGFPKILSQPERYSGVETLEKWLVDVCDADLGASVFYWLSPEVPAVSSDFFRQVLLKRRAKPWMALQAHFSQSPVWTQLSHWHLFVHEAPSPKRLWSFIPQCQIVIRNPSVPRAAFHDVGFTIRASFVTMHNDCLQRSRATWAALNIGVDRMCVVIHN